VSTQSGSLGIQRTLNYSRPGVALSYRDGCVENVVLNIEANSKGTLIDVNINNQPFIGAGMSSPGPESELPSVLIEQDPQIKRRREILGWWYSLTSLSDPPEDASLAERERARRGRLASTVLFFVTIILLLALLIGIVGPNHFIAVAVSCLLLLDFISLLFNRRGHTNIAGAIISLGFNVALVAVILSSPLTPSSIQIYDILIFVEIFIASLLPPNGLLLAAIALANLIFIEADITFQAHTASFAAMLATDGIAIRIRPIIIHVVVTGVIWLWVWSASRAIARADRAEVIANLEHVVAEQERAEAMQKRQLDDSIQQIVDTHIQVANGNFQARVPLSSGTVLWQIAGPLNTLLARFQRQRQEIQEAYSVIQDYQKTRDVIARLVDMMRDARTSRRNVHFQPTHTMLDPLLRELESSPARSDSPQSPRYLQHNLETGKNDQ